MTREQIAAGVAAAIKVLNKDGELIGCDVAKDGRTFVQIECGWYLDDVVEAILKAAAEQR